MRGWLARTAAQSLEFLRLLSGDHGNPHELGCYVPPQRCFKPKNTPFFVIGSIVLALPHGFVQKGDLPPTPYLLISIVFLQHDNQHHESKMGSLFSDNALVRCAARV